MSVYLFDTNIVSYMMDENRVEFHRVKEFMDQQSIGDHNCSISCMTLAEILFGRYLQGFNEPEELGIIRSEVDKYSKIWYYDEHTLKYYAEIKATLFNKYYPRDQRKRVKKGYPEEIVDNVTGKSLGVQENDIWIVATAVQYRLKLITRDKMKRLCQRVKELYSDFEAFDPIRNTSLT